VLGLPNDLHTSAFMKFLPIGVVLLTFLVMATQMPPTADVVEEAKKYFSEEVIEQGQNLSSQRRWIMWGNALAQFGFLVYLVVTPLGKTIYLKTGAKVQNHWIAHLVLLGGFYFLASAAIALPFRLANYFVLDSWGLVNQSLGGWFGDFIMGLVVTAMFEGAALLGLYAIIHFVPQFWWLAAGGATMVFGFFSAFIYPDVVEPLFNTFTPIGQTEWKTVEPRIKQLGVNSATGVTATNIFVVDASRQSKATNAYFTGFGSSQRIVLYDNFLKSHWQSPDEIDTVIAHEMGHWWHRHILQGIVLGSLAATGGFYLLSRHLEQLVDGGALVSPADPAGLFRIILLAQLAFAVTLPVQNWASRIMEAQADETALHVTDRPQAFIAAEKKFAIENKSNVAPSRLNVILFATHPPVVERIQMAERWKKPTP
jgi:STE24 endopeptidase